MSDYPQSTKVEFDNLFKVPVGIDVAHHEVHEGDSFSMVAGDPSAGTDVPVQLYIETPAVTTPQKRMHLALSHRGSGEHTLVITEGITFTSGGAAYAPVNRRRDSAKVTAAQAARVGGDNLTGAEFVYTGGTIIWTEAMGTGKLSGGESRGTRGTYSR